MGTASQKLVGRLIANRYLVGEVLGSGGLCTVYRGEDLRRQRDVAIKVLPGEKARVTELAARFQREVTSAKRIDHPNVAAISDSGKLDDGGLFLVMELLRGRLLSQVLAQEKIELARAFGLARQVLTGLAEAHRLGIVHRDVKPDNVMLTTTHGLEVVKLFDFGIASNERAALKLTAPGTAFGTPQYISPEMAMGQKVDARADLYTVGVMLFEMAAGRLPFQREDDLDLLRAHISEEPPKPSEVAPERHLPAALDALITRAMKKKPDERFASAEEMIFALDAAAGHRPLEAPSSRWRFAMTALVAALLAAACAWFYLR